MRRLTVRQVLACLLVGGALSWLIAARASFSETGDTPKKPATNAVPPPLPPLPPPTITDVCQATTEILVNQSGNAWWTNKVTFTLRGTAENVEGSDIVFFLGEAQSLIHGLVATRESNNKWVATWTSPGSRDYKIRAALTKDGRYGAVSDEVEVRIRTVGPYVVSVDPQNLAFAVGRNALRVQFNPDNPLDPTKARESANYELKLKDAAQTLANIDFDPVTNTVTLSYGELAPGVYKLTIKGPKTDGSTLEDLYGNTMRPTGLSNKPDYEFEILKPVGADLPSETRGIRAATGPYVEFPEYTKPRPIVDGFNPSDKVDTRVARLYYFRDAHRVAQIINREVRSYNRTGVDVARQLADKARVDADAATDARRHQEFLAVEAARETRRLQHELESLEQTLYQAQQIDVNANRESDQIQAQLRTLQGQLSAEDQLKKQNLEARSTQLDKETTARRSVIEAAAQRVQVMAGAVQQARQKETPANEQVLAAQAQEDRTREEQFRREVAAAHEDPDTYVPGKINSLDPVRQVSVSVIGEGLIQLRGPMKGINVIRMMINQIDAPVGQVRVGIHTVQINGERGERMEKVADRVQKYIDHSRFLTLQSGEMLRKAVAKVAAQKAMECGGSPGSDGPGANLNGATQDERDMRYLYSFFGQDFICELRAMDSEFLKTGNKLLSLHSMDTTSLASALFVLALAKNDVRKQILDEFEGLCRSELPAAEQTFFEAGFSTSGHKFDNWFCKERFQILANNARFQSLRGMFDAEIMGPDTISPIQREFIRLAQIFKSRLIVELQYKQRIMERAVIEDRLGDRIDELRKAKKRDEDAQDRLTNARDEKVKAQRSVLELLSELRAQTDQNEDRTKSLADYFQRSKYGSLLQQAIERIREGTATEVRFVMPDKDLLYYIELEKPKAADKRGTPSKQEGSQPFWLIRPRDAESTAMLSEMLGEGLAIVKQGFGPNAKMSHSARQHIDGLVTEWDKTIRKLQADAEKLRSDGKAPVGKEGQPSLGVDLVRRFAAGLLRIEKKAKEDARSLTKLCGAVDVLFGELNKADANVQRVYQLWLQMRKELQQTPWDDETAKLIEGTHKSMLDLVRADLESQFAQKSAESSRRPLDHKKFLDMLIDEIEDKYIELLEGTRAHTANVDAYIKRLVTSLDDDFNTQFYQPAFRQVRSASRAWDVTLGQVEYTSILANNREFAKVSPQATMEFDLPKRDILITEAMQGAKAMIDTYGALVQDPSFLALTKMKAGQPTSSPPKSYGGDFATVRNVLPGLPGSSAERIVSQSNPGNPQLGAPLEALIPDPAIYKFETGTGYEIRPVIQPDGQAVVFHLNYMYTTNIREPVRADEKHLGRVKRHFIDTDVQLSNYELREVSRYLVALKASRTSRGVPLLENIPVAGALFRPLPSAESSLQQNIILGQATIFPTLFDLMGLRWAPAIADLDPQRVVNDEFVVRNRSRALMNRVFDHSSSEVDKFLRIPEGERRPDLYRSQETIPREHPDGYRGPGLNLRDSQLREGYSPLEQRPDTQFVPGSDKEGVMDPMRLDPPQPPADEQSGVRSPRPPLQGRQADRRNAPQRLVVPSPNPVRSAENAR